MDYRKRVEIGRLISEFASRTIIGFNAKDIKCSELACVSWGL